MRQRRKLSKLTKIVIFLSALAVFVGYSDKILGFFPDEIIEKSVADEYTDNEEGDELPEKEENYDKKEANEYAETDSLNFYFRESPHEAVEEKKSDENIQQSTESPVIDEDMLINNDTSFSLDVQSVFDMDTSYYDLSNDDALKDFTVLIVHTHGSEAYTPGEDDNFLTDDVDRTIDKNYNVVRVGDELESLLESAGINVIHDESLHDYPTYSGSYSRSLDAIKTYMKKDPSIKLVIDLHRDAFLASDGSKYRTYAKVDGRSSAQLMFVVGTDEGGLSHPNWRKNLSFALKLQAYANNEYPGLMRPIHLRSERFNQHCTPGSMLIEVGSSGNTLDEALTAVAYFADILISVMK